MPEESFSTAKVDCSKLIALLREPNGLISSDLRQWLKDQFSGTRSFENAFSPLQIHSAFVDFSERRRGITDKAALLIAEDSFFRQLFAKNLIKPALPARTSVLIALENDPWIGPGCTRDFMVLMRDSQCIPTALHGTLSVSLAPAILRSKRATAVKVGHISPVPGQHKHFTFRYTAPMGEREVMLSVMLPNKEHVEGSPIQMHVTKQALLVPGFEVYCHMEPDSEQLTRAKIKAVDRGTKCCQVRVMGRQRGSRKVQIPFNRIVFRDELPPELLPDAPTSSSEAAADESEFTEQPIKEEEGSILNDTIEEDEEGSFRAESTDQQPLDDIKEEEQLISPEIISRKGRASALLTRPKGKDIDLHDRLVICRYARSTSVQQAAQRYGLTQNRLQTMLLRMERLEQMYHNGEPMVGVYRLPGSGRHRTPEGTIIYDNQAGINGSLYQNGLRPRQPINGVGPVPPPVPVPEPQPQPQPHQLSPSLVPPAKRMRFDGVTCSVPAQPEYSGPRGFRPPDRHFTAAVCHVIGLPVRVPPRKTQVVFISKSDWDASCPALSSVANNRALAQQSRESQTDSTEEAGAGSPISLASQDAVQVDPVQVADQTIPWSNHSSTAEIQDITMDQMGVPASNPTSSSSPNHWGTDKPESPSQSASSSSPGTSQAPDWPHGIEPLNGVPAVPLVPVEQLQSGLPLPPNMLPAGQCSSDTQGDEEGDPYATRLTQQLLQQIGPAAERKSLLPMSLNPYASFFRKSNPMSINGASVPHDNPVDPNGDVAIDYEKWSELKRQWFQSMCQNDIGGNNLFNFGEASFCGGAHRARNHNPMPRLSQALPLGPPF